MSKITVKAEAVLNAPAKEIYNAIADYQNGHPHIVPPENFSDLRVEQGGYGEGTIIRFTFKTPGLVMEMHHRVSEPEPGRVLVEQDIDAPRNIITSFTVDPVGNGEHTRVEIATTMNAAPGLAGVVEHILVPQINGRIYRKELKQLETFAQSRLATAV